MVLRPPSQFYTADVYQIVDYGIDGQPGRGVNLQLACDVAPVGDDCVGRDTEMVGYLLVCHSLCYSHDDILFPVAQHLVGVRTLRNHVRYLQADVFLLGFLFQPADDGNEDFLFYLGVQCQPSLTVVNIV